MMAWLTYKWFLMFATIVQCAPEGYNYKKPNIAFALPNQINLETQNLAGQSYHKAGSYSVSHEHYRQRNEQIQNSVGISSPVFDLQQDNIGAGVGTLPLADVNKGEFVQNSAAYNIQNSVPVISNSFNSIIPPVLQLQGTAVNMPNNYNFQNGASVNNGAQFNAPVQFPSLSDNLRIASQNYQNAQQLIRTQSQKLVNGENGLQSNQITAPAITKHIYFHVPPPDVEHTFNAPPQSKKTYKILFIKLPQQSSRNNVQLQSSLKSVAPIEEKTLIYVLVKKPEQSQVIVPTIPKLSEHEVLFVKYKDNLKTNTQDAARVVEIPKRNPQFNVQVLQPGTLNGKW